MHRLKESLYLFSVDVFYFRANYLLFVLPLGKCKHLRTYLSATSLSITCPLATWPGEEERREGGIPELVCSPCPLTSLLTTTLSVLGTLPFHFHIQEEWEVEQHLTLQCHTPVTLSLRLPSLLQGWSYSRSREAEGSCLLTYEKHFMKLGATKSF